MENYGRLISKGKICDVYLKDPESLTARIVKVYKKENRGYFRIEEEMLGKYGIINFPVLMESYEDDGAYVLVTEYIEGKTLHEMVSAQKRFCREEAVRILRLVVKAVQRFHRITEGRYFLCDLSPGNIIIRKDGEISLVDLNSVCAKGQACRSATPGFSSEESFVGAVADIRADIYSLGKLFLYMLTGEADMAATAAVDRKDAGLIERCIVKKDIIDPEDILKELDKGEKRKSDPAIFKRCVNVYGDEVFALELLFSLKNMGYRAVINRRDADAMLLNHLFRYNGGEMAEDSENPDIELNHYLYPRGIGPGMAHMNFVTLRAFTYEIEAVYEHGFNDIRNICFVFYNYDKRAMLPLEYIKRSMPDKKYVCISESLKRKSCLETDLIKYLRSFKADRDYRKIISHIIGERKL